MPYKVRVEVAVCIRDLGFYQSPPPRPLARSIMFPFCRNPQQTPLTLFPRCHWKGGGVEIELDPMLQLQKFGKISVDVKVKISVFST